jgi:hypothetical protein
MSTAVRLCAGCADKSIYSQVCHKGGIVLDFLRCVVERITYQNEQNGYTVIKCKAKGILIS